MIFIRRIFLGFALLVTTCALLVATAALPAVQTWLVARALAQRPELGLTIKSVSISLQGVTLSQVHWHYRGNVLTIPTIEAKFPLTTALRDRRVHVQSLVAKGWILERGQPAAAPPPTPRETSAATALTQPRAQPKSASLAPAGPAPLIRPQLADLFPDWTLPFEMVLDGIQLAGAWVITPPASDPPIRGQLALTGGGLAPGKAVSLNLTATSTLAWGEQPPAAVTLQGGLHLTPPIAQVPGEITFNGTLSAVDGQLPDDLQVAFAAKTGDGQRGESYALSLQRDARHLATLRAVLGEDKRPLTGTWDLNLDATDCPHWLRAISPPFISASGKGTFNLDTHSPHFKAAGRLNAAVTSLGVLMPRLTTIGPATLESTFDLTYQAEEIRFESLTLAATANTPLVSARAQQPFTFAPGPNTLTLTEPTAPWLEGTVHRLPITCLNGLVPGLTFSGGDAHGDYLVNTINEKFTLRSPTPFIATGVNLHRDGQPIAEKLDLTMAIIAESTPRSWRVQGAPLTVRSAGRPLATIAATVTPLAGSGGRMDISGEGRVELAALATQPAFTLLRYLDVDSATGKFSAKVGAAQEVTGQVTVRGRDPTHTLMVNGRAYFDGAGGGSWQTPVTITMGSSTSEISADATWRREKTGPRVQVNLHSVSLDWEHGGRLASPWAAAAGIHWPAILTAGLEGPRTAVGPRDHEPFWGKWTGRVQWNCYRLRMETSDLHQARGVFIIEPNALRLEDGQAAFSPTRPPPPPETGRTRRPVKAEAPSSQITLNGAIAYDAAAENPYRLEASAAVDVIDAARWFTTAQAEKGPVIEGRFSMAGTIVSSGNNLEDLAAHRQEKFRLASRGGIVRLLKTNVAAAMPDIATPVADALATVGSAVGWLLGLEKGTLDSGKSNLSKEAAAVLNFTYIIPEIRYDELTLTANRGADRKIHCSEIALSGAKERLTGTGLIGFTPGRLLREEPLSLDLRFGARGTLATLLTTTGLLSSEVDEKGYLMMAPRFHFGGTLEQVDPADWHAHLLQAANQKTERVKKSNGATP